MNNKQTKKREQTNKPSVPSVADAERTLAELVARRGGVAERKAQYDDARQRLAYAAHVQLDAEASRELGDARSQALRGEAELAELDAAIATARDKLAEAQAFEAKQADMANARALRAELAKLAEFAKLIDDALDDVVNGGDHLLAITRRMNQLGGGPNTAQLDALGVRAVLAALGRSIWRRSFEMLPPNQRHSFSHLVQQWSIGVERSTAQRLGEQITEAEHAA